MVWMRVGMRGMVRVMRPQLNLQLLRVRRIMQKRHWHVPAQILLLSLSPYPALSLCSRTNSRIGTNVEPQFGSGTRCMPTRRAPTPARAPRPSKIAKHGRVAAHLALAAGTVARGRELRALVLLLLLLYLLMLCVLGMRVRVLVGGVVRMGVAWVGLLLVEREGVCGGELEWFVHVVSSIASVGVYGRWRALLLRVLRVLLRMMSIHLLPIPIRLFIRPRVLLLLMVRMMPLRVRRRRLRQHRRR